MQSTALVVRCLHDSLLYIVPGDFHILPVNLHRTSAVNEQAVPSFLVREVPKEDTKRPDMCRYGDVLTFLGQRINDERCLNTVLTILIQININLLSIFRLVMEDFQNECFTEHLCNMLLISPTVLQLIEQLLELSFLTELLSKPNPDEVCYSLLPFTLDLDLSDILLRMKQFK